MTLCLCVLQHRFQPQNPLQAAQAFSPREAALEDDELRLSAHTLLLPTRGQMEARMMVTAFEMGLDNVSEDAVSTMFCALEVCVCEKSVRAFIQVTYSTVVITFIISADITKLQLT